MHKPLSRASTPAGAVSSEPGFDWALWATGALLMLGLVAPKLLQHASANTADLDTGNYSNFAWGILHGQGFYGGVLGRHHLGEHFSPIMILVAPLYLLRATAYHLMFLQGTAVAGGLLLLVAFARSRLREAGFTRATADRSAVWVIGGVNALLLTAAMLYPPLLATFRTQFQPIELGFPLVIAAILLLHGQPATRRNWALAGVVLLLLMTRESAPLSVLGLAIYAAGVNRRWRAAAVLVLVAGVWAAISMGLVMPWFRDGGRWGHSRWFGLAEADDPNAFMWRLKAEYLLFLVGGLGFLPLVGSRALCATAAAVPGILLNLSVKNRPQQVTFDAHYDAQICAFLLVAAALGATWLAQRLLLAPAGGRARGRRLVAAGCAGLVLAAAASVFHVTEMISVPQRWVEWWPTDTSRRMIQRAKSVAREHEGAPILAGHARVGPHIGHRLNYRSIRAKTPRQWEEWAAERLEPGTILIIPGEKFMEDDGVRGVIRASGHAQALEVGPYIEVYRWPADAPPAGTPEAEAYVRHGMRRAR